MLVGDIRRRRDTDLEAGVAVGRQVDDRVRSRARVARGLAVILELHPGGAVGAALELVAVDVVEDGARDAAEGGVADCVDGVGAQWRPGSSGG